MRVKLLSSLFVISGIASAAAPIDGWYSNYFGAFAYLPGNVNTEAYNLLWNNARNTWGFNAGGAIGFKSNPLRYELQYTYTKAQNKTFTINDFTLPVLDGYTSASLGMANVYYDFPDMVYAIAPYVGAGLGYGYVTSVLGGFDNFRNAYLLKRTDSAFAWQITAGLNYNFMENIAINVDYRYISTTNLNDLGKRFQGNFAEIGVTYRFDDFRYK